MLVGVWCHSTFTYGFIGSTSHYQLVYTPNRYTVAWVAGYHSMVYSSTQYVYGVSKGMILPVKILLTQSSLLWQSCFMELRRLQHGWGHFDQDDLFRMLACSTHWPLKKVFFCRQFWLCVCVWCSWDETSPTPQLLSMLLWQIASSSASNFRSESIAFAVIVMYQS